MFRRVWSPPPWCEERISLSHFILKSIVLPRQARGKHSLGKTQKELRFLKAGGANAPSAAANLGRIEGGAAGAGADGVLSVSVGVGFQWADR